MNASVVDTNVPVVANGKSAQADPDCVIACIKALTDIRERGGCWGRSAWLGAAQERLAGIKNLYRSP